MNIEERILTEYQASLHEDLPTSHFEIFASGYKVGLRDVQMIYEQMLTAEHERVEAMEFNRGEAQGLAYAAYAASHVSTVAIHAGMTPAEAAAKMRDNITAALELARILAIKRADA